MVKKSAEPKKDMLQENLGLLAAVEKKIVEGFYRLQEAHVLINAIKQRAGFETVDLRKLACINANGLIEVLEPELKQPVECKS